MPEQISLDDSSYEEIYEKAMETLHNQAPWWTHTEVSDPGITLLEMWALLSDMQSFYLDQVSESHYRKYLKLLGIRPDEGKCAGTWVFFDKVDKECIVPCGTKLLSDQMVFETEEEVLLTNNSISGFYQEKERNEADVMKLSRKSRFVLRAGEEGLLFCFSVKESLHPGDSLRFFVLLDEREKRNAGGKQFYMAGLAWEYQSGDQWHEAQVMRDDTRGLLFSGCICIRIKASGNEQENKINTIRCRIKEGAYDVMPVLYKICLNFVRVIQKNTLCCEETLEFTKNCHRAALKSYLGRTGKLWILREKEKNLWEDITEDEKCRTDPPITAECMDRHVTFNGEGRVKVVCMAADMEETNFMKDVTGITSQEIILPWNNVRRSCVKLMIKQDSGLYRAYHGKEPEEERYEHAWHWKEEENVIVLGDGRHGEIPPPSVNGLHFTSMILWEGDKGNVSIGRIAKWENDKLFPNITCTNRLPGKGGRKRIQPSQQFEKIKERLGRQNRMVTGTDIRNLVMETPGLMIEEVRTEWKDGVIVITVTPKHELNNSYCIERYRRQIEKHLEPYRLVGTVLKIQIG